MTSHDLPRSYEGLLYAIALMVKTMAKTKFSVTERLGTSDLRNGSQVYSYQHVCHIDLQALGSCRQCFYHYFGTCALLTPVLFGCFTLG